MFVCDVCGREGCWGLGWILDVVVWLCLCMMCVVWMLCKLGCLFVHVFMLHVNVRLWVCGTVGCV